MTFIRHTAASITAILLIANVARPGDSSPPPPQHPNILFILVDDMGYADLSCFGGRRVDTPNIDRLAAEGIRFTQFYVNSPICSPSRVALTTGQYPGRWRITSFLESRAYNRKRGMADWLSPEAPSLARFLENAGYYTAHVGKWHMGGQRDVADAPPISRYGFATSLTNFEGLGPRLLPVFEPRPDGSRFNHGPTDTSAEHGGEGAQWIDRHRVTEAFVDRAIEEIATAQKLGRPFYINLWTDDPHTPMQAPPDLRGDGSPQVQYLGVLVEMDRQLGRIIDHIRDDPALRECTLILFASDNGHEPGFGSAGDLRGSKATLYEGGLRSPLIVWSPALLAREAVGTSNDVTVIAGFDLPVSLLTIASIPPPAGDFDGIDLSAALVGQSQPARDPPIMFVRPPDRPGPRNSWPDLTIRSGPWKLLINRDGSRPELFHIPTDPTESTNLAADQPELVADLARQVIAWDRSPELD